MLRFLASAYTYGAVILSAGVLKEALHLQTASRIVGKDILGLSRINCDTRA
jgi:hypothetical protein